MEGNTPSASMFSLKKKRLYNITFIQRMLADFQWARERRKFNVCNIIIGNKHQITFTTIFLRNEANNKN